MIIALLLLFVAREASAKKPTFREDIERNCSDGIQEALGTVGVSISFQPTRACESALRWAKQRRWSALAECNIYRDSEILNLDCFGEAPRELAVLPTGYEWTVRRQNPWRIYPTATLNDDGSFSFGLLFTFDF